MKPNASFEDLISQSSLSIQESARLKQRARDTITKTAVIIDRSRELLLSGLVSGSPSLKPSTAHSASSADPAELARRQASRPTTTPVSTAPEKVVDRDYVDETVAIDGRHFMNCTVTNCVLEYFGGPVLLESTSFTGCRFRFGGEAAMTVAMLQCFGILGEQSADFLSARTNPGSSYRVN